MGSPVFCPSLKPYTFEVVLMSSPISRTVLGSDEDEKLLEHTLQSLLDAGALQAAVGLYRRWGHMLQSDDGTVCGFSGVRDRFWSFSGSYSRTGCSCRSTIQVLGSRCPTDLEILSFAKHFPQSPNKWR